jgi:hypothetical protein
VRQLIFQDDRYQAIRRNRARRKDGPNAHEHGASGALRLPSAS